MSNRPPLTSPLAVHTIRIGGDPVVELRGELDVAGAPESRDAVLHACTIARRTVVLDLGGLTFMDSRGVEMILEAHALLRRDGRRLVIARAPGHVRRLLELCGLAAGLELSDEPPTAARRDARVRQAALAAAVRAMRSLDGTRTRRRRPTTAARSAGDAL